MVHLAGESLSLGWSAFLHILCQPMYYVSILFVILQVRKQIYLERKMFHTRLHSLLGYTLQTTLWGVLAGFLASIILMFIGTMLTVETLMFLWLCSLILVLFQVRFLCMAYASGILAICKGIAQFFPNGEQMPYAGWWIEQLNDISVSSLLILTGVLHLAEGSLMRIRKARLQSPVFLEGKRGKVVGGYHVQGLWPVPLLLIVPGSAGFDLPWLPLLNGEAWSEGAQFLAFPVLIGFSESIKSQLPETKVKVTSLVIGMYSVVMIGTAFLIHAIPSLTVLIGVLTIALHEGMILYSRYKEEQKPPFFVHSPYGMRILGVIPGAPAAEMGIEAGEVLCKVNGIQVVDKEQLHRALNQKSAFCKLEVMNHEGEIKFLQRAVYSGEHYQLGLILAPDDDAPGYVNMKQQSLLSFLKMKLAGWHSRTVRHVPQDSNPQKETV